MVAIPFSLFKVYTGRVKNLKIVVTHLQVYCVIRGKV